GRQHLANAGQQSRGGVDSQGRGWRRTVHRLTSYADFARHWKLRILRIWLIALRHLAQGWYAVCFFTRRTTGSGGAGSDPSRAAGEHVRPDRCHPGAFDLRAGRQARYRATDAYPQARDRGAAVLRSFGKSAADRPHLQSRPRPLARRRSTDKGVGRLPPAGIRRGERWSMRHNLSPSPLSRFWFTSSRPRIFSRSAFSW